MTVRPTARPAPMAVEGDASVSTWTCFGERRLSRRRLWARRVDIARIVTRHGVGLPDLTRSLSHSVNDSSVRRFDARSRTASATSDVLSSSSPNVVSIPFWDRNVRRHERATRLFPSGRPGILASRAQRTAALVVRSGYRSLFPSRTVGACNANSTRFTSRIFSTHRPVRPVPTRRLGGSPPVGGIPRSSWRVGPRPVVGQAGRADRVIHGRRR